MSELKELDLNKPLETVDKRNVTIVYSGFISGIENVNFNLLAIASGKDTPDTVLILDKYGRQRHRTQSAAVRNVPMMVNVITRVYRDGLTGEIFYEVNDEVSIRPARLLATFTNEAEI